MLQQEVSMVRLNIKKQKLYETVEIERRSGSPRKKNLSWNYVKTGQIYMTKLTNHHK